MWRLRKSPHLTVMRRLSEIIGWLWFYGDVIVAAFACGLLLAFGIAALTM